MASLAGDDDLVERCWEERRILAARNLRCYGRAAASSQYLSGPTPSATLSPKRVNNPAFLPIMRFNPILPALPALAIAARCAPTGPVLPKPHLPESFEPAGLQAGITTLLNSTFPTWNVSTTSFSLELTSLNSTFFSYHHTAADKSDRGVEEVDSDSVYRIASITKVFNVLALLLNAPRALDTPITEYVSELEGSEEFAEITLRMLAGQVSGLRREGKRPARSSGDTI